MTIGAIIFELCMCGRQWPGHHQLKHVVGRAHRGDEHDAQHHKGDTDLNDKAAHGLLLNRDEQRLRE